MITNCKPTEQVERCQTEQISESHLYRREKRVKNEKSLSMDVRFAAVLHDTSVTDGYGFLFSQVDFIKLPLKSVFSEKDSIFANERVI